MDAIELLKSQHREVEAFFHEFRMLGTDAHKSKQAIFEMIADGLAVHAQIEEQIFYPAAKFRKTEKMLKHSVQEHLEVKRMVAEIMAMQPTDAGYDAKVSELEKNVQHHVQEEEAELFRMVQQQLGSIKLQALGEEMGRLATELQGDGAPREAIPAETDHPAPI